MADITKLPGHFSTFLRRAPHPAAQGPLLPSVLTHRPVHLLATVTLLPGEEAPLMADITPQAFVSPHLWSGTLLLADVAARAHADTNLQHLGVPAGDTSRDTDSMTLLPGSDTVDVCPNFTSVISK